MPSCHYFLAFKVPPEQRGHSWGASARIDSNRNSSYSSLYKAWNDSLGQTCFELAYWFNYTPSYVILALYLYMIFIHFTVSNLFHKVIFHSFKIALCRAHDIYAWIHYGISIWLYFKWCKPNILNTTYMIKCSIQVNKYISMHCLWNKVVCACYR